MRNKILLILVGQLLLILAVIALAQTGPILGNHPRQPSGQTLYDSSAPSATELTSESVHATNELFD